MTHAELVALAARWLRVARRHPVVLSDLRTMATNEQPDVIGWMNSGFSTLIECKASRADFLRDAKKGFRRDTERGMGYERYYLAPAGLLVEADMPTGWGLLAPTAQSIRIVRKSAPFMKRSEGEERRLLVNAVRRVTEADVPDLVFSSLVRRHFGMGRIVRGAHETCVIATRGRASKLVENLDVRSSFFAPVGEHSEKPDAFFAIVERLSKGPYVELFSRRQRPGWTCLGSDLGTTLVSRDARGSR